MKNKVLLKALKGATSPEEMIELINDFKEDTTVVEPVAEPAKVVEPVKEVEPVVAEPIVVPVVENNQDVKDLIARVKQLEDQKIESDTKMQEWVELANTLAKDKPFGIVNKVTKKEITQTMYDMYDADKIIGK